MVRGLALLSAICFFSTAFLQVAAQGTLKAEVTNTNCPVSNKQAYIWHFGQNAGIDFNNEPPNAISNIFGLNVPQGCAVIADSSGNLLFYTDGMNVYNRIRQVMPNGSGMGGNLGVSQPAVIVPKPGNPNVYYVFTVDLLPFSPTDTTKKGFSYSEVDLTLNGGLGDVTSVKNENLLPIVSSKVSAVQHANGVDYWVLAHRWNSNEYCAFLVSADGVSTNYVGSNTGISHSGDLFTNNFVGNMIISHDGSKVASAVYGEGVFEIADFNTSTGQVTNAITSPADYDYSYGIAFSPDVTKLYGSTAYIGGNPDTASRLYQFDVTAGAAIFQNPFILDENTSGQFYCGMQLAPDGKIYIARAQNFLGFGEISVIYNPNRPGSECNLDLLEGSDQQFDLAGSRSSWGMTNFVQSFVDIPHFNVDSVCHFDSTYFRLRNEDNVTSVSWDFGDPQGFPNTSTDLRPYHVFSEPGQYTVTVTETYNSQNYTYSEVVTVNELPFVELGDTLYMYPGSPIRIDAGEGFESYFWITGETASNISVSDPGTYWVIVENNKCCFSIDSVEVVLFDVLVPNAFRPGGVNRVFRARPTSDTQLENFQMFIYNRWGQLVFESEDVGDGWDGTINGSEAPSDVYVWVINYFVERNGGQERITYKGNVVLLR
jgi:gliding motility-associated-like protein